MPTRFSPEIERQLHRAQTAQKSGQMAAAERIYSQLLRRWPDLAPAHNGLGLVFEAGGRPEAAVSHFEQAIDLAPEHAPYYNNLGMALQRLRRHDEAERACRMALKYKPEYPEAWNNLGNVYFGQDEFALARGCYREAVRYRRNYAKAWMNLARSEWELKRTEATRRAVARAIRLQPTGPAWVLLAQAESAAGRHGEALAAIDHALAMEPGSGAYRSQKGGILRNLSRYEEALSLQRAEVQRRPDDPDAWNELGLTLDYLNQLTEAEQSFDRAIQYFHRREALAASESEESSSPPCLSREQVSWLCHVRLNRSFTLLKQGRFDLGWREYAYRWDGRDRELREVLTMPRWRGESLAGKHLVVATEQGAGDTVQFARYLHRLRELAPARLTLAATRLAAPIFRNFPGIQRMVLEGDPMPEADYYCLFLDLPLRFGTRVETIPCEVPYFTLDPDKAAYWEERLRRVAATGFRVGLAWQGNPKLGHDHHRSFPLAAFEPLFDLPGVQWIKLQKGEGSEQMATANYPIVDLTGPEDHRDIMDTAAIMHALDLVITPDSMLAHLAGAFARPVWVPLASRGEWRWLTQREDSPWYPTLRLFRQTHPGDWKTVMSEIRKNLLSLLPC